MAYESSIRRYRSWYKKLLRLYSRPYYERFGEGMEQTFGDVLRERAKHDRSLFACALGMFVETFAGIVRENMTLMVQNKNLIRLALVTVSLLLVPLVAMQFSHEVAWGLGDFVVASVLIFGTGLAYELGAKRVANIKYRIIVGVALLAALTFVWAGLAVGIFTT